MSFGVVLSQTARPSNFERKKAAKFLEMYVLACSCRLSFKTQIKTQMPNALTLAADDL